MAVVSTRAEAAFEAAIGLTIQSLQGGEQGLIGFAQAAVAVGEDIETIVTVLEALNGALDENKKELSDYAVEASKAGRSAKSIAEGIARFDAVLALTIEPLTQVEQQLKNVDAAADPVIQDLLSLGLSIDRVAGVTQDAVRAIGVDFIERITQETEQLQNPRLAEFTAELRRQADDLNDASTLLARGGITQDEFRLVEQRNALAQKRFFETLSQDDLNALGDYLGLIRENGGEAAVVLLEFNQELDRTKDRLIDGLLNIQRGVRPVLRSLTGQF